MLVLAAVCDPVMGDHGKLYVKPEVVPCYQEIVPLATIMTPNQFEVEKLVGECIVTEEDALAACNKLHSRGVATVVSTFYVEQLEKLHHLFSLLPSEGCFTRQFGVKSLVHGLDVVSSLQLR